ncbi:MAG: hypothetical protein H6737_03385 [Alphaproteobacteria bacterium]|nr:hypothetical protein [Alphaproteobacteria bacterium]
MKRALLAVGVALSLACGGFVDQAKQRAGQRLEAAKRDAIEGVKKEVQQAIEREMLEYVAEQGLDAEMFEITDDGIDLKMDGLEVQSGPDAQVPAGFPLPVPEGAKVQHAGVADQEGKRTAFVVAQSPDASKQLDAWRTEVAAAGWTLADAQGPEAQAQAVAATKGDEQLVLIAQGDGRIVMLWVQPSATSPAP